MRLLSGLGLTFLGMMCYFIILKTHLQVIIIFCNFYILLNLIFQKVNIRKETKKENVLRGLEKWAYKHGLDPLVPQSWYHLSKLLKIEKVRFSKYYPIMPSKCFVIVLFVLFCL